MIRELHWQDFQTPVDLLFTRLGWRRTSLLGDLMPDIDIALEQPLTGETAWVQIKAHAQVAQISDYAMRFGADGEADRGFLVCANAVTFPDTRPALPDGFTVWQGHDVAERALDAGLTRWIASRLR